MVMFQSFRGTVISINDFWTGNNINIGCTKMMSVQSIDGNLVNFIVMPTTYFVDNTMVSVGNTVTGFYDVNAPTPMIYPPQYQAIIMAKDTPNQNVKVDFFNQQLVSRDGSLKLSISPSTLILLENGQIFTGYLANRNLIVVYGATTRSIPAQTTPSKIVVIC
jgi:hypothetical protein